MVDFRNPEKNISYWNVDEKELKFDIERSDMQRRYNELDIASKAIRESTGYGKIIFTIDNDKLQFVNVDLKKKV